MEGLLFVSGALLFRQYRREKHCQRKARRTTTAAADARLGQPLALLPRDRYNHDPVVDYQNDNIPSMPEEPPPQQSRVMPRGSVCEYPGDRMQQPSVTGYRPSWLRVENAPQPMREVVENNLANPLPHVSTVQNDIRDRTSRLARTSVDHRQALRQVGNTPVEQEFVRPPGRGGPEGYDSERGRMPIPRYNTYDLGPELTSSMEDNGAVRGARNSGIRSRSTGGETWEIMPNRTLVQPQVPQPVLFPKTATHLGGGLRSNGMGGRRLGATFLGASPQEDNERRALEWDATGGTGKHFKADKGVVYPEHDPTNVMYMEKPIIKDDQTPGMRSYVERGALSSARDSFAARLMPEAVREQGYRATVGAGNRSYVERGTLVPNAADTRDHYQQDELPTGNHIQTLGKEGQIQAAPKTDFTFSFALRDFLKSDQPRSSTGMAMAKTRDFAPTGNEREVVETNLAPNVRKLHPLPGDTSKDAKNRLLKPENSDVRQVMPHPVSMDRQVRRHDVAPLPPGKNMSTEKKILFSEEERNSYKTDDKKLNMVRHDLSNRMTQSTRGLASAQSVTKHVSTSLQFAKVGRGGPTLNSGLRLDVSDAPQKAGIGDARITNERRTDGAFVTKTVQMAAPMIPQGVLGTHKAGSGVSARHGVVFHPSTNQKGQAPQGSTFMRSENKELLNLQADQEQKGTGRFAANRPRNTVQHESFSAASMEKDMYENDALVVHSGEIGKPMNKWNMTASGVRVIPDFQADAKQPMGFFKR